MRGSHPSGEARLLAGQVGRALGVEVTACKSLAGGQVGHTVLCTLQDGWRIVAKASPGSSLEVEAYMLRYLAEHSRLPVPGVLHAEPDLLVEELIEGSARVSPEAERHAGELLADLHSVKAERFGLERDTLIGPLPLDNAWTESWPDFYARRRLLPMAELAAERGRLPASERKRVERLAASLPDRFDAEPTPALIHGDVWAGNVLTGGARIAAFLDPAIYYADTEVELAFIDLFHTFGEAFYQAHQKRRPLAPGYLRWRRRLYQVFLLLVHAALFGGTYLGALRSRLEQLEVQA